MVPADGRKCVWQKGVLSYDLMTHNSRLVPHDLFKIQTVNLAIETVFAPAQYNLKMSLTVIIISVSYL